VGSVRLKLAQISGVAKEIYFHPQVGDVDITRENLLVGIGRGIQRKGNLEL
jgi:sulfopyruvate decarboxylase TPP-binding subunit